MITESIATLEPFLDDKPVRKISDHKYEKGMFLSINNHATYIDEILLKLRYNYQTILYWATGENIDKKTIKCVHGKTPTQKTILDLCNRKIPLMVGGIHNYDQYDKNIGRGSNWGTQYQHLHLYIYGIHHYLPSDEDALKEKINHLCKLLSRHNKRVRKHVKNFIDVKPVGYGKYQYNDIISAVGLHEYLNLPITNPSRQCCINYIADTQAYEGNRYPLSFTYKA